MYSSLPTSIILLREDKNVFSTRFLKKIKYEIFYSELILIFPRQVAIYFHDNIKRSNPQHIYNKPSKDLLH